MSTKPTSPRQPPRFVPTLTDRVPDSPLPNAPAPVVKAAKQSRASLSSTFAKPDAWALAPKQGGGEDENTFPSPVPSAQAVVDSEMVMPAISQPGWPAAPVQSAHVLPPLDFELDFSKLTPIASMSVMPVPAPAVAGYLAEPARGIEMYGEYPEPSDEAVDRVMERVQAVLADRLNVVIADLVRAHSEQMLEQVRDEVQAVVQATLRDAVSDALGLDSSGI